MCLVLGNLGDELIEFEVGRVFSFGLFFFGCDYGMQKFSGEGSNTCQSSDNAASLTSRPPGNSKVGLF